MPHEQLLKKLLSLGFTGYEAKAYLAMNGRQSLTASELSRLSGVPRQRIYDVVNNLHLKGLCEEIPGDVIRYQASKPKDALMGLLVDRNREFQQTLEEQRDIALHLADELSILNRKDAGLDGPGNGNGHIRVYNHPNQMLRKYDELLLEAEEEILCTAKLPYIQARAEETYEKVRPGIKMRFLIDEEVLEQEPAMIEAIFRLYGNHEIRFAGDVPIKVFIFDRKKVLLVLTNDHIATGRETGAGLSEVFIDNPGLASGMARFFELIWEKGTPASSRMNEVARIIAEVNA